MTLDIGGDADVRIQVFRSDEASGRFELPWRAQMLVDESGENRFPPLVVGVGASLLIGPGIGEVALQIERLVFTAAAPECRHEFLELRSEER